MRVIGNHQVHSAFRQYSSRCFDHGASVLRSGQTISDGADPQIPEILVVLHLRIECNEPTDQIIPPADLVTQEILAGGIEDVEYAALAARDEWILRGTADPECVRPIAKIHNGFRRGVREGTSAPDG